MFSFALSVVTDITVWGVKQLYYTSRWMLYGKEETQDEKVLRVLHELQKEVHDLKAQSEAKDTVSECNESDI